MILFFNDVRLQLDGAAIVAITYVANDLSKMESVQSSYSNTINVPDTIPNRAALGYVNNINSLSVIPYRVADVQVLADDNRELLPFAKGEIIGYSAGYFKLLITAGNIDVFELLADKSIKDLNLSLHTHTWNIHSIAASTKNKADYVYPLVWNGKPVDLQNVDVWQMYPATFAKLILNKIFEEAGLVYTGLDSEFIRALILPASDRHQYSGEYIKEHSVRAGILTENPEVRQHSYNARVKFETVTGPGLTGGSKYMFQGAQMEIKAQQTMKADINAGVLVYLEKDLILSGFGGLLEARLDIEVNGVSIAHNIVRTGNALRVILPVSAPDVFLNNQDLVSIRYTFTLVSNSVPGAPASKIFGKSEIYNRNTEFGRYADYFEVKMLPEFPKGGEVVLSDWLPDIKQSEFLKFCLQLECSMMQTDQYSNLVKINKFEDVETNTVKAYDWSKKLIPDSIDLSFKFGSFAQKNLITWQEDETVKKDYGNGYILVDNRNLPLENTLLNFPFAATETSSYYNLPALQIWKEREGVTPKEYDKKTIRPRVLLQSTDLLSFTLKDADNNITKETEGFLTYFDLPGKELSLDVSKYTIPNYYSVIEGILSYTKTFKALFKLDVTDVQSIDFSIPVWIDSMQNFFYINKINNFIPKELTEVELIRL